MEQSILKGTKKILGIGPDDTSFDFDIIQHINSAFGNMHDLGLTPPEGFQIEDDTLEWDDLLIEDMTSLNMLKTCIYLRVRMLFDPPTTSYLIGALEKQIEEHDWRLSVQRENREWTLPIATVIPDVIDGGTANP